MGYIPVEDRISVDTAAAVIGKSANWVRWAVQAHEVSFGNCVSSPRNTRRCRRYSYYINKYRLAEFACVPVKEIERLNRKLKAERKQKRQEYIARKEV